MSDTTIGIFSSLSVIREWYGNCVTTRERIMSAMSTDGHWVDQIPSFSNCSLFSLDRMAGYANKKLNIINLMKRYPAFAMLL